jgi:hypothetical protein
VSKTRVTGLLATLIH